MTEGQWGFLIGGALMLSFMPTSLFQANQKSRMLRSGEVRDAMLRRPPRTTRPRLVVIGVLLAAVWAAVWLVVWLG